MSRPRSDQPRKIPVSISFDTIVIKELRILAREFGRTVPSLINSLAANHLLLLGRLALELEPGEEAPECDVRFNQSINDEGRTVITRRMTNEVSEDENSLGRAEFLRAADVPGAGSNPSPKPGGKAPLDRTDQRRERVRL